MSFTRELHQRNSLLHIVGWIYLSGAGILLMIIPLFPVEVLGINALIKPTKFLLSSTILVWTAAWLMYYLAAQGQVQIYSWIVVLVMSFENIYITWQAFLGELSHFNDSSDFHRMMFTLMGWAIGIMTGCTILIGIQFYRKLRVELPAAYLWGIRLGILLFVIFAFEGYGMGAIKAHTVGGPDGGEGLPFVNWSTKHGDLRIAHFLGMHALQILPLAGYYVFRQTRWLIVFAVIYLAVVTAIMVQAVMGISLLPS
ncbi:MAG: hypothetical protein AAFR36_28955 [Bacteroidota bacterium]